MGKKLVVIADGRAVQGVKIQSGDVRSAECTDRNGKLSIPKKLMGRWPGRLLRGAGVLPPRKFDLVKNGQILRRDISLSLLGRHQVIELRNS